jgi:Cys-tRNA(Pro) deacylase
MAMADKHLDDFSPDGLIRWLDELGVRAELIVSELQMPTVELAAAAIGVDPNQIVKTLLFRDRGGNFARVIASGPRRIDRALLAAIAGLDRPKMASAEMVLEITGWPAGGVAPVGSRTEIPTFIDQSVMEWDVVFGGGGTELTLLRLQPADIARLTNATIADLVGKPVPAGE